ncbi:hypothetical protein AAZV13_01G117450 [Glycine max]
MADRLTRIAIVSNVRCKPKKFRQECKKSCPRGCVLRLLPCPRLLSFPRNCALDAVFALRNVLLKLSRLSTCQRTWTGILLIDMVLILLSCIGKYELFCQRNLRLWLFCLVCDGQSCGGRLPVPRPGQVLGLVGTNGIGKSTALKVLAGKLKPNLGRFTVIEFEFVFLCC